MYPTDSLLTFSFPMGRLLGVPLRLSFLMPVVAVALMWRMHDIVFGAVAGAIMLLSLLLHEVAHLLMARRAGCLPDTVVIWPLGGLPSGQSRMTFSECVAVFIAGPFVNLSIAIGCAVALHRLDLLSGLWNPFAVFDPRASDDFSHNCLRLVFLVNYCLAIFNLIPVRPLDAGQIFSAFLNLRFVEMETRDLMLRIGLVASLFGILAGFVFDVSTLVALSAFLLVLHIHEVSQWTPAPTPAADNSFMGYDFSEGYTSLDRTEDHKAVEEEEDPAFGILDRWKARREEERSQRELEERQQDEEQLDLILEKLHTQGRDSLTSREINLLNRVSARLRQRNIQG
jgi:Zn-dependent protease